MTAPTRSLAYSCQLTQQPSTAQVHAAICELRLTPNHALHVAIVITIATVQG